jgi:hypothetical protein
MKGLLGVLALAFGVSAFAQTPSAGRDYSDLWFNAQESGWGVNVIQQDTILFVTLFVYGPDRRATWYVGPSITFSGTSNGADSYTGELYSTTGTPFGTTPFDANSVAATPVGTLTFIGRADGTATLTYTVSGTQVTKAVGRQTWRANTIAATQYFGATSYVRSQCANPAQNGPENDNALYTLTVTSSAFTLVEDNGTSPQGVRLICNWNGTYSQEGRLGRATGTVTCEDNVTAPFTMTDLQINSRSFGANWTAQEPVPRLCRVEGRIGGTRR